MSDLICREDAIDAILNLTNSKTIEELFEYIREHDLAERWSGGVYDAIDAVIGLPSAQPEQRWIDGDKLMMMLVDWWYSSFRETETDEAKAIRGVMDQVEDYIKSLPTPHQEEGEQDG